MGKVGEPHLQTYKKFKKCFCLYITGCDMTFPDCTL